jgi:Alpha-L-arabinofuranosidase B, catalytic
MRLPLLPAITALVEATFLLTAAPIVNPALAQLGIYGDQATASGGGLYAGPCDLIAGGCAAAYSVDRAMTSAYSGNLFQLIRDSDNTIFNVGQTPGHVVNTSGIASFCNKANCYYNVIYDQIGAENLTSVTTGTSKPAYCSSSTPCVTPFWFDPETGLPIVRTGQTTSQFDNETADPNIIGGSHAISVYSYGGNQGWSTCCGSFGVAHSASAADTVGTMFSMWVDYGNASTTYQSCSTSTTICAGIDEESANLDGASYTPTASQDIKQMITWDGQAATNTVKVYVNSATPIYSNSPPCAERSGCPVSGDGTETMNIQTTMRLGGGGDNSHVDRIFREGFVSNTALAGGDFTHVSNNESAFFGAYTTPAACEGIGDFSMTASYNGSSNIGASAIGGTLGAYGLYRMRASYWGPIATLRDNVTNVETTYGPASAGCGLDPAAASACASDGCSIVTLYNQEPFAAGQGAGTSAHNSNTDLTQSTSSEQPTVTFNSLNGLATMHFSGGQEMCSGSIGAGPLGATWAEAVVRRTGNTANPAAVFTTNSGWMGFQGANDPGGYIGGGFYASPGVADGTWISEVSDQGPNLFYVGGTNRTATGGGWLNLNQLCIGNNGSSQALTGDIAEVAFGVSYAMNASFFSDPEAQIYSIQQAFWGTLD